MRYIASVSFGKDSLAMLLKLIEENKPLDEVVFYDTGMEFQAIYNIRDKVKTLLESKDIKYTELKPKCDFCYKMFDLVVNKGKPNEHKGYSWCGGNKQFPLAEWKMTEKDCLKYCYDKGFNWNEDGVELYSILDRVSCWCCANKNLKELKNYYLYLPKYWQKLKDLQAKTDRPFKYNKYTIFDLEKRFKKEQF